MARTTTLAALNKQIDAKTIEVRKCKTRYEDKESELKELMAKRERLFAANIIKAYRKSRRTYDDVMDFLVCDNY